MKSPIALPAGSRRASRRHARRGRSATLGLAALAAATLAGCAVDNTPTAYDDQVRTNFIASCTGSAPTDASTTTTLAPEGACVCAYDVFAAKVPYNTDDRARVTGYPADKPTFQELENELANDPNRFNDLPEDVRQAVEQCQAQGNVGPVAPGTTAAPTGTTAGTTPA